MILPFGRNNACGWKHHATTVYGTTLWGKQCMWVEAPCYYGLRYYPLGETMHVGGSTMLLRSTVLPFGGNNACGWKHHATSLLPFGGNNLNSTASLYFAFTLAIYTHVLMYGCYVELVFNFFAKVPSQSCFCAFLVDIPLCSFIFFKVLLLFINDRSTCTYPSKLI